MILLETSVLSRVFRRRQLGREEDLLRDVVMKLVSADMPLGLPGPVLQEVLSGIREEKQLAELERKLLASFTIVQASTQDYIEAARLRNRCLAAGVSVSGPDCLIAVLAIAGGHELLHVDQDFDRIAKHSPLKIRKIDRGRPLPSPPG